MGLNLPRESDTPVVANQCKWPKELNQMLPFSLPNSVKYDCISYINESNQYHFVILSDSRCALLALQKYLNPKPLVQMIQCHIHSSPKEIKLCWVPIHVGVPLNEVADELAKGAVTNQNVKTVNLPRSDYRRVIKYSVTHKWKEKWNHIENNKYREITPHNYNPITLLL